MVKLVYVYAKAI